MMTPASLSRRRALSSTIALLVTGCSLAPAAPVKATYILRPPAPSAKSAAARKSTLKVDSFNVASAFRSRALVYRDTELRYQTDFYVEFLTSPAAMISEATASWLAESGIYRAVLSPSSGIESNLLLEGFVTDLYGDLRSPAQAYAVMSIKFFLTDTSAGAGAFLWTGDIAARALAPTRTADGLVRGLNVAFGDVLEQLATALQAVPA